MLETLAEWGPKSKDLEVLTEYVRNALRRTICNQYTVPGDRGAKLVCVTLDPALEEMLSAYVDRGPAGTTVNMPARVAGRISEQI
ncbi:MAG: FHIPEP family type III secretion protein, partial [bacterium]